ncbi:histidine kinase [Deinococcus phoenicis]|uniref:histidine kinase n=2 Tax=Deinococcus TaxID=1298 RepID=A0A016QSK1_9DEIO|nr:HAMP domain-containing sensor histidine kinase [Deinococcus phoenicis]EYB68887.1 histidine kinase [Deinococcus phoenicis]
MAVPTARDVVRQLFPPPRLPLSEGTVWGVALSLMAVVLLLDVLTPATLAVGTLLTASVAFAALGASRRTAWQLTGLAVLANLIAGVWNGVRDGVETPDAANRAVSILAVLLVGYLTIRARAASERAAALVEEERQLRRERALRGLAEDMGGPLGQTEFVERAAAALLKLTGARRVEIGAVDRAMLRAPHALARAPGTDSAIPSRLDTRVPLEFLAHPVGSGDVWATDGGQVFLARLRRPTQGDLLVILTAPQTPPSLTGEAIRALQPLLERTTLLDDLRANREQLAEQGELLRDLVYAFSHDLRTPLLANAMNMQAALKGAYGPLPEDYRATLANGLQANETLLDLADQLLLVARYESGEAAGEDRHRVDLRGLTLSVVNDLRPHAQARRVTLDLHLDGAQVRGDRHDLRRAVQNLLDNAIKFSPPGGTVGLSLAADGDEAVLTVQDEGSGVPPGREGRLFQRFRSGGAGGGTGLGLYLTRRIAEAHGGSVRYSRTAQARSLFTLALPLETRHE